ncbi:ubiquitin family protein [Russula emetica]|nr:ubiquitin family protein [Russula emetica]
MSGDLILLASIPGYPDTSEVELTREVWPVVSSIVHSVTIVLETEMLSAYSESDCSSTVVSLDLDNNARPAPNVRTPAVRPSRSTFSSIFTGQAPAVRKPVIYLYPPSRLPDVTVKLLLTSSWSFSAIHPLPQTAITPGEKQIAAQSLTWTVDAEPDGRLVDKTSGTEVTYLYWEATVNSRLATPDASRATTPVEDIEAFDPSRPSLSPGDSILLPIGKIPGYLDAALKALTLHTEARTSFITYWLPSLLKHEYIALRFIAQSSYEKAAQMRVLPTPDVVTRVFMLFRGVHSDDVGLWAPAATRAAAEDGATFWSNVVGVDAVRASDRTLFRVLEWGGMEVE